MFKPLALASALALAAAPLAGCSTQQTQQFAANAASTAQAIGAVNTAVIQLNATIIANQTALAQELAAEECPLIDGAVSLGKAIAADPAVAKTVQAALTAAGPTGALLSDLCAAAGLTAATPVSAAPASAVVPTSAPASP